MIFNLLFSNNIIKLFIISLNIVTKLQVKN